jgi:MOSC domain-containing protein YiiM
MKGIIAYINFTPDKKEPKKQIQKGKLIKDAGLEGDAYNKPLNRQISLISTELISEQAECPRTGAEPEFIVKPGSFKETLTTEGIDLSKINIGDIFKIGNSVKIRISEKGMTCWEFCPWNKPEGECPLPKNFLFAEVIESGEIKAGDDIIST